MLMMQALEGGAEDVDQDEEQWIVTCPMESYDECKKALQGLDGGLERAELTRIPDNLIPLSKEDAQKLVRLLEHLDELDDVQETYSNGDFGTL
jgi:transcriptional/translational regulatory protein YebC/TACO1